MKIDYDLNVLSINAPSMIEEVEDEFETFVWDFPSAGSLIFPWSPNSCAMYGGCR